MWIIAVTGSSRHDMNDWQAGRFRDYLHFIQCRRRLGYRLRDQFTLLAGGAVHVDQQCVDIAQKWAFSIEVYPSNLPNRPSPWRLGVTRVWPPAPPLERNQTMVDRAGLILAFPDTEREVLRSGTWATIRYAKKMHKHLAIIFPGGSEYIENGPIAPQRTLPCPI